MFTHYPVGGTPDKPEGPEDNYWQQLVPMLHEQGVDLLLTGHSHTYGWSFPLTGFTGSGAAAQASYVWDNDTVYAEGAGVVQVVSGLGGRELRPGTFDDPYMAVGYSSSTNPASEYGYTRIGVTQTSLIVDYVAADNGAVVNSFTILQNAPPPPPQPVVTTLTLQNGVNGYSGVSDTYLHGGGTNQGTSFGAATIVKVDRADGSPSGQVHGLIRFDNIFGDGTSQIGVDKRIVSATTQSRRHQFNHEFCRRLRDASGLERGCHVEHCHRWYFRQRRRG